MADAFRSTLRRNLRIPCYPSLVSHHHHHHHNRTTMNAITNSTAYRLYLGRSIQTDGQPDRLVSLGEIREWIAAEHRFAQLPGWTMLPGHGGWSDDDGKRINEPTMVLEFILATDYRSAAIVRDIADSYADRFRQSAVMLTAERVARVEFRTGTDADAGGDK